MKLELYEKYKDSGVEWLGEIPEHWSFDRIKNVGSVNGRVGWKALKASEYIDSGYFFLSTPNIKDREIDYKNVNYITYERYVESPEIMLKENDILLVKDGSTLGIVNIVKNLPSPGTVNSSIAVLRFKKCLNRDFIYFLIVSNYLQTLIGLKKDGMGVPHLFQKDINNFLLLLPPLSEQTAIAHYLNQKTISIDKKIAVLTQKIEHYQALHKSLINETVCRGLDKSVALKDSGIEWIGKVPEHWEVKRLKDVAKNMSSGATPLTQVEGYYEDGIVNWVNTGDLNDGIIEQSQHKISQKAISDYPNLRLNKKGTLLVAMYGATIGKIGILNIEATTNQACCCINLKKDYLEKFIFYWFLANKNHIISLSVGGTQPNISQGIIGKLLAFIPPSKSEQTAIATYLDEKTQKIDDIISNIKTQIERLKELRKTLINDVVTGKIKVV